MYPLVTVVTPTWNRNNSVFRAIRSVVAQVYRPVQHIVVSDGPNPELTDSLRVVAEQEWPGYALRVEELPEHDNNARWGHRARLRGIELADGDYIAYLDDDDEFLPDHIAQLAGCLLRNPGTGFAYSRILIHDPRNLHVSGQSPPSYGQISTSSIMNRKEILKTVTWRDEGQETIDWDIADRWMQAGIGWAFYDGITSQAHRDAPNLSSNRPRTLR